MNNITLHISRVGNNIPRILITYLILTVVLISCSNITKSNDPKDAGDNAPGFSLESSDGTQVSLDDFSGKVVLLFFFGDG